MNCKIGLDYKRAGEVDIMKELKLCEEPLIIFGAGMLAEMVTHRLRREHIHYDAICVDGRRAEGAIEYCFEWDEIDSQYEKYNVIVAHAPNLERIKVLRKNKKISKIFFCHSYDWKLFDAEIVSKHSKEYEHVFKLLQDEYSKECIIAYLNTRMSGDMQYVFDVFKESNSCFKNTIWSIGENESFWDIGAYTGNLIHEFLMVSKGKYKQIVALEPNKKSFEKLQEFVGMQKGILTFAYGVWNENGYLAFTEDEGYNQCFRHALNDEEKTDAIECITLDDLLAESEGLLKPTLLRFNYDGGVEEALQGAEKILKQYQPKLVICIGFDEIGFVNIIHAIRKINAGYKFYIRFNRCIASAINLYAI